MTSFSAESFAVALAIIGVVIVVSALLSGVIDRSASPQVAFFLTLGAVLGPFGLGLINLSLDSVELRVVATLSLTLVLFTDAVSLNISEVRRRVLLTLRLLGPGTLLTAALIAVAGWSLLGLPAAAAAILGAALASSDPVLMRGLLRRRDIPTDARHGLQLESGLNDVVLLPVVLVAILLLTQSAAPTGANFAQLALDLFILGPGAGILVGLLGVAALDLIRKRVGVRRDYESLYSLGIAFTAFAAAEAVHGSGFLAAFAAGITIAALDVELCDCFIEYGGVTAEMLLLFTFVLLGSSLIWSGLTVITGATVLFTAIAIVIRPPVYLLSLIGSSVSMRERLLIAWFGPRGLSSLLLILLPVFAAVPGSERLFAICSLVVLVSVVLHGGSPMVLAWAARKRKLRQVRELDLSESGSQIGSQVGKDQAAPPGLLKQEGETQPVAAAARHDRLCAEDSAVCSLATSEELLQIGPERISLAELEQLQQAKQPITILDVRTERSLEGSNAQAQGAVRMPPEYVVERARELGLNPSDWLIAYCA